MRNKDHTYHLTSKNVVTIVLAQNDVCLANEIEGLSGCSSNLVNEVGLTFFSHLLSFFPDVGQDTNVFPE